MTWNYVTVDKQGPVALVRFDRKENFNAFNQQLVGELTEVARTFYEDLETHYVVLAGAREAFSSGADLKDAASWKLAEKTDVQRRHRFYAGVRLCKMWEEMPQITIAAMERMAVGADVAIALACDGAPDEGGNQRHRRSAAPRHRVRRRRPEPAHGILRGGPQRARAIRQALRV